MRLELIATSTFGLEALVKREVQALGFQVISTENGRVTYVGDERGIVKSNLWLRYADRVLIKMGEFDAWEFEDLFQGVKGIAWEEWIPFEGNFKVDCSSVKSRLFSLRSCQSVGEKAIIERLRQTYGDVVFPKTHSNYVVKLSILKDHVIVTLDTTGEGLHKRGYRVNPVAAPIKETIGAAMVNLSFFRPGRMLLDPCCGSGTIPIEAALLERNIAPGLSRTFVSQDWHAIKPELWREEKKKAFEAIDYDKELKILAWDISKENLEAARENAEEAGVEDCIEFRLMDACRISPKELMEMDRAGMIVTNPPYGTRIGEEKEIRNIYKSFAGILKANPTWSLFVITPEKNIEKEIFKRQADRRRKLYNGNIEVCYYQFFGKKEEVK